MFAWAILFIVAVIAACGSFIQLRALRQSSQARKLIDSEPTPDDIVKRSAVTWRDNSEQTTFQTYGGRLQLTKGRQLELFDDQNAQVFSWPVKEVTAEYNAARGGLVIRHSGVAYWVSNYEGTGYSGLNWAWRRKQSQNEWIKLLEQYTDRPVATQPDVVTGILKLRTVIGVLGGLILLAICLYLVFGH